MVKDMVLIDGFIGKASQTTLNNLNLKRTVGMTYKDAWGLSSINNGISGHFKSITETNKQKEETSSLIKQADATVTLNNVNCDALVVKGNFMQGNKFACLLPAVANQIGSANRVGSTFIELDDIEASDFAELKDYTPKNPIITH